MAAPPPLPPSGPRSTGSTNLGVAPNVGGLLCYAPCCIGLIFSIVAVIVEKQSRFLRFHAFQGLFFHAALIVVVIAVQVGLTLISFVSAGLAFIGSMLWLLVALGILALEILLMVKAYNNEEYELPTIGQLARKYMQ
jgi:uncharacterized membrane protein